MMLDRAFDAVYEASSLKAKVAKSEFELLLVRDPLRRFLFESNTINQRGRTTYVIRTSSETIATIAKITIARHLYGLPRFEERWLAQYLLYIRKTPDGGELIDPLRASGLISMKDGKITPGVPDFTDAYKHGINDAFTVISFMVAHELYHLEYAFKCDEARPECDARRRQIELHADRYAIDILQKLALKDPTPDHRLAIPTYVFMQLALTMERADDATNFSSLHPPHHERVRAAALALQEWTVANPESPSAASLREICNDALTIVDRILAETPAEYFAGIDEESSKVTLESLKVY